jgi:hypothetical protein
MTVKNHTPSGAQNSTSARTKKRPAESGPPKGKADAQHAADRLTAERIRAILSDPGVKESVRGRVQKLVGQLYESGMWDTLPETPEYFVLLFEQTHINDHLKRGTADPEERAIYDRLAAIIERHEPKDARAARTLLAVAYDDKGEREMARQGMCHAGTVLDALTSLTSELSLYVSHPDILPHAARLILREAEASKDPAVKRLFRELRAAVKKSSK